MDIYWNAVILLTKFENTWNDISPGARIGGPQGSTNMLTTTDAKFGSYSTRFFGANDDMIVYGPTAISEPTALPGPFTLEGWVKPLSNRLQAVFGQYDGTTVSATAVIVRLTASGYVQFEVKNNFTAITTSATATTTQVTLNQWHHIACTRDGSNVIRLFVDGILQDATGTDGRTLTGDLDRLVIGGQRNGTLRYNLFDGYIDEVRFTKGFARYISSFTPPITEFPTVGQVLVVTPDASYSNVSLLLPIADFGTNTFLDFSATPKTVSVFGNSRASDDQYKWYGFSGYFDGSGDYLTVPYSSAFDWWASDFTVECWIYVNSLGTTSYIQAVNNIPVLIGNASPSNNTNYWSFGPVSTGHIALYYWSGSMNIVTSTNTLTASSWNHIALVKTSAGINLFINGVGFPSPVAINGTPLSSSSWPLAIGQINGRSIDAYMNDLRITSGVARYTTTFTPPNSFATN